MTTVVADAAALDAAIAALRPDDTGGEPMQAALRDAAAIAQRLAAVADIAELAAMFARTLAACADGVVEPHHAQWRMASAALTLRQQVEQLAAGGAVSPIAMRGAAYELEVLFPRSPDSPVPPSASDLEPPSAPVLIPLGRR